MKRMISTEFVAVILLSLMMLSSVHALGVTPSRKIVDFNTDLKQEISFTIINDENKDIDIIIYPRGDLAAYVLIEDSSLHIPAGQREETVRYKIDVPYEARKPGINTLELVIEESPSAYDEQTAIGGKVAVVHQLQLRASYYGSYLTSLFSANDPDYGNPVLFSYALFNEGTEPIDDIRAEVAVYDVNLRLIAVQQYDLGSLAVGERRKEERVFDATLNPGAYQAIAQIFYEGGSIRQQTDLIVGQPSLIIEGVGSSNFKLGSINRIDVALYNTQPIELKNVFAEITVKDKDNSIFGIFRTIPLDMLPLRGEVLFGYWDTARTPTGIYKMSVKVFYNGRVTEKDFEVEIFPTEFIASEIAVSGSAVLGRARQRDSLVPVLVVAFIVLMIINILFMIYIRKRRNPPQQITQYVVLMNFITLSLMTAFYEAVRTL